MQTHQDLSGHTCFLPDRSQSRKQFELSVQPTIISSEACDTDTLIEVVLLSPPPFAIVYGSHTFEKKDGGGSEERVDCPHKLPSLKFPSQTLTIIVVPEAKTIGAVKQAYKA